jgi:aspartate 1-decarboxylase
MLRAYITSKVQGITVTDACVDYHGSVSVDQDILVAAGIEPYEQVHVVNLTTGARWITYVLPSPAGSGAFILNGGGARLGVVGDRCVLMAFALAEGAPGARVVFCNDKNGIRESFGYPMGPQEPATASGLA